MHKIRDSNPLDPWGESAGHLVLVGGFSAYPGLLKHSLLNGYGLVFSIDNDNNLKDLIPCWKFSKTVHIRIFLEGFLSGRAI